MLFVFIVITLIKSQSCVNGYPDPVITGCTCEPGWTGFLCETSLCQPYCVNGQCVGENNCDCDEGWGGSICDQPICDPSCVNGVCTNPDTCECYPGWEGNICQFAICDPPCLLSNGFCVAPGLCSCEPEWTGPTCEDPACDPECVFGECVDQNVCECDETFSGEICNQCDVGYEGYPICQPICNPDCYTNGECVSPGVCECDVFWSGTYCTNNYCADELCNNGVCSSTLPEAGCDCDPGWTGPTCVDEDCFPTCLNGICVDTNVCDCDPGWSGSRCGQAECPSGCGNGVCSSPGECACEPGWEGELCDTFDCETNCQNGNCTTPTQCECDVGWGGAFCDEYLCNPDCDNGICVGDQECECDPFWGGLLCNEKVCNEQNCINGRCFAGVCTCNLGYFGTHCEQAICEPECVNGICVTPGTCECDIGWTGPICDQLTCTGICVNGVCDEGLDVCICDDGWTGTTCADPECAPSCVNGECVGPYTCECEEGWDGPACDDPVCQQGCVNGECVSPGDCVCGPEWTGESCEDKTCLGRCVNGIYVNGVCQCNSGWEGEFCDELSCDNLCINGICNEIYPFDCVCSNGWTGENCDMVTCVENCVNGFCNQDTLTCECTDPWEGVACDVQCSPSCENGVCVAGPTGNTCDCDPGWSGNVCGSFFCNGNNDCVNGFCNTATNTCDCGGEWEGVDCSIPFCPTSCVNGECIEPYTCDCDDGWGGSACDVLFCDSDAECGNGYCDTFLDICVCGLNSGWEGPGCNTPVCFPECVNGDCVEPNTCACYDDWHGPLCDQTCSPSCFNGVCNETLQCECDPFWTGISCDTQTCDNQCVNGICDIVNYECICDVGWTGVLCDEPVCSPDCGNGECVNPDVCDCDMFWFGPACDLSCTPFCLNGDCNATSLTCECDPGWGGDSCELQIFNCSQLDCGSNGECGNPGCCDCNIGWEGESCEIPMCNSCVNGQCIGPDVCECNEGWEGGDCITPICFPFCENGDCVEPNTCACDEGWSNPLCDQALCDPVCINGACVRPNVCECYRGWGGALCDERVVCFEPMDWSIINPSPFGFNPPSSGMHGMAILGDEIYMYSGAEDWGLFRYSILTNTWDYLDEFTIVGPYPSTRLFAFSMTEDDLFDDVFYLYGGYDTFLGGNSDKLWIFDSTLQQWFNIESDNDRPLSYHTIVKWKGDIWTYGGVEVDGGLPNDKLYRNKNLEGWYEYVPMNKSVNPPALWKYSLYIYENQMYLFGGIGENSNEYHNSLYIYTFITNSWGLIIPDGRKPSPRHSHDVTIQDNKMYIYGGFDEYERKDDLWKIFLNDYSPWEEIEYNLPGPGMLAEHTMVPYKKKIYIFGGIDGSNDLYSDELWMLEIEYCCGCDEKSCVNGFCIAEDTCQCDEGWQGDTCSTPICDPSCVNGICSFHGVCTCYTGWTGSLCEDVVEVNCTTEECPPYECTRNCNNGICVIDENDNEKCVCNGGWYGESCVDALCSESCVYGTCTSPGGCDCNAGWQGVDCDVPICDPECINGTCIDPNLCCCNEGWTGELCDEEVVPEIQILVCDPPCVYGSCVLGTRRSGDLQQGGTEIGDTQTELTTNTQCECLVGWSGDTCDVPICDPECLHGTCIGPDECCCDVGYDGPLCAQQYCETYGECELVDDVEVIVDFPLKDPDCAISNVASIPQAILSAGACTEDGYFLLAGAYIDSDSANNAISTYNPQNEVMVVSFSVEFNDLSGTFIMNLGTDLVIEKPSISQIMYLHYNYPVPAEGSWTHSLTSLMRIEFYEDKTLVYRNSVLVLELLEGYNKTITPPLSNDFLISSSVGGMFFSDFKVSFIRGVVPSYTCYALNCDDLLVCSGHGLCIEQDKCLCETEWAGDQCDISLINCTVNECPPFNCTKECVNGGICTVDEEVTQYCTCPIGYEGEFCEIQDFDYECTLVCENGGFCVVNSMYQQSCSCPIGWTNALCQDPVCDPGCVNGVCTAPGVCTCNPGWEGSTCEVPICGVDPLFGDCVAPNQTECIFDIWQEPACLALECPTCGEGSCVIDGILPEYQTVCKCNPGYTGPNCSIPECLPYCENGGICSAPGVCKCTPGWEGSSCEVPICSQGCANGDCTNPDVCECKPGWTGDACDEPICDPTCINGYCVAPNICKCDYGWTGDLCDEKVITFECILDCGENGQCAETQNGTDGCLCDEGWGGLLCDSYVGDCLNRTCEWPYYGDYPFCEKIQCFGIDADQLGVCGYKRYHKWGVSHGNCIAPDTCECCCGWNTTEKCGAFSAEQWKECRTEKGWGFCSNKGKKCRNGKCEFYDDDDDDNDDGSKRRSLILNTEMSLWEDINNVYDKVNKYFDDEEDEGKSLKTLEKLHKVYKHVEKLFEDNDDD